MQLQYIGDLTMKKKFENILLVLCIIGLILTLLFGLL